MTASIASSITVVGLMAVALLLVGCGDDERPPSGQQLYHPPAYHPDHFPDIPLYPIAGYQLIPGDDQLAVSLAGGTVRRFEVSMIQRDGAPTDPPAAVLARYASELPTSGWTPVGPPERGQWRKGGEDLFLEAGRSGGLTTMRFHLRPTLAGTPAGGSAGAAPEPAPPARPAAR